MPDWDADSPRLRQNLKSLLTDLRDQAQARTPISVDQCRTWHKRIMDGLNVPNDARIGVFRGEKGIEDYNVRVGSHAGVVAEQVADGLAEFDTVLKQVIRKLDDEIPTGTVLDDGTIQAIVSVCAWCHTEWIRIHPFCNGNGRTARLWANAIAMRYGLPPFVILRPRPGGAYAKACERAMTGDYIPMIEVFQTLLIEFIDTHSRNFG